MNYQTKVQEYKNYRAAEIAMGRTPLNMWAWESHMTLLKSKITVKEV